METKFDMAKAILPMKIVLSGLYYGDIKIEDTFVYEYTRMVRERQIWHDYAKYGTCTPNMARVRQRWHVKVL